jgi:hypothetical protein
LLVAETSEKQLVAFSASLDSMIRQGFTVAHVRAN